jgi:ankyrin repeat protein
MGRTALHFAARLGRIKSVRALLGAGVDSDARASEGLTALAHGALLDHPAVVEVLIRAGAAVDACCLWEGLWLTPLHFAARRGNAEMVGLLWRAGADPSARGSGDPFWTLEAVITSRSPSPSVVRLLIEAGADLEAKDRIGLSVPDLAAKVARDKPDLVEIEIASLLRQAASGGLF